MCDTDQFSAFEWIRKNKKHKNKSIGFLFKNAKISRFTVLTWIHHLQIEMTRVHIPFWHTWGHGELDIFSDDI